MPSFPNAIDSEEITNPTLSDHAQKLIQYSKAFRRERPEEATSTCIDAGLGQLVREYRNNSLIAHMALTEVAALQVFGE